MLTPRKCSNCGSWMEMSIYYNFGTANIHWKCPNGCTEDLTIYYTRDTTKPLSSTTGGSKTLNYCSLKGCLCENATVSTNQCQLTACIY